MENDARWLRGWRTDPLANPDEPVEIKKDGRSTRAFVFPAAAEGVGAALHMEQLTAGDLVASGWVRISSDDVALLRITSALEAIVRQNEAREGGEPSAMTPEATRILQEAVEIQERRARTP